MKNGCPVAMETVQHTNVRSRGMFLCFLYGPSHFFPFENENFALETQFGQSLEVDVSVVILAAKKDKKTVSSVLLPARKMGKRCCSQAAEDESEGKRQENEGKSGAQEEIGTDCAKFVYSSSSVSTTTGRREAAFFLDFGAPSRPACTSVSRKFFRSSSP